MDFKDGSRSRDAETAIPYTSSDDSLKPAIDTTRRKLKPRHIQLIGIGGWVFSLFEFPDASEGGDSLRILWWLMLGGGSTIGTALFVQIGGFTSI